MAVKKHKVKSGESLSAIAKQYKVKDWRTIWEADENQALVKKRKKPEKIQVGDELVIPSGKAPPSSSASGSGKSGKSGGPQSEADAVKKVDKHVSPAECFIWFMNSKDGYQSLTELSKKNTGCAHWVAHQKNWKGGKAGNNGCNKGYLIRVKDVAKKSGAEVEPAGVKVGNVWVNATKDHCGIVSTVTAGNGGTPTIEIEHCSSGQGKVAKNDWAKHFKSKGTFYKG